MSEMSGQAEPRPIWAQAVAVLIICFLAQTQDPPTAWAQTRTQTYQPGEPRTGLPGGAPGRGAGTGPSGAPSVYCQNWPGRSPYPQYPGTGPQTPCGPAFQRQNSTPQPDDASCPENGSTEEEFSLDGALFPLQLAAARQPCNYGPAAPVEIRFRAFIPAPAVAVTPNQPRDLVPPLPPNDIAKWLSQQRCSVTTLVNLDDCLFRGDGRGFSYAGGTHRYIANVVLQRGQDSSVFRFYCRSHEYQRSEAYHPPDKPWWWFNLYPQPQEFASERLQVAPENSRVTIRRGAYQSEIRFWMRGTIPLVAGPPIDADFTVYLRYPRGGRISAAVDGYHDGFPAYEIYVNGQMIKGDGIPYRPDEVFGASPYSLINSVVPQVKLLAGEQFITQRYNGRPPPNPPACQ